MLPVFGGISGSTRTMWSGDVGATPRKRGAMGELGGTVSKGGAIMPTTTRLSQPTCAWTAAFGAPALHGLGEPAVPTQLPLGAEVTRPVLDGMIQRKVA
jgi:hypothetical protein